ncbi:hypothetical protein KIN20_009095 [Parelaphostrongylus tenuis]|uniref:NADP-dependent oxidoreductase domain-containing protein n=1 Tax=Parelaphostrongylus tenuis TaxID=148309 RepID=A0AAD5QI14_PARTN|nr:hypothetical protein KIN20_009095 [Parelaphostrongylus tenuis]
MLLPLVKARTLKKICSYTSICNNIVKNIYIYNDQAFSSLARHEPALVQDPMVLDMAKKHNTTVPMILLSWALSQGVGIIPKSATPERIVDNFKVTELKLSEEEIESLHKLNRDQHYIRCYGWRVL